MHDPVSTRIRLNPFLRIVPRNGLLFVALLLIPFGVLAALFSAVVFYAALAVFVLLALLDAIVGFQSTGNIKVHLPEVVRLSKDKEGSISIRVTRAITARTSMPARVVFENASAGKDARAPKASGTIRIGLPFPDDFEAATELSVRIPEGVEHSYLEWNCKPLRRGKYHMDRCYVEESSPFGFWNIRFAGSADCELRVYPNLFEERKKLAARFLSRDEYGMHARRMVGQGREFEKLREYVPGDGYDQIHWKATAKRSRPITKVFQIERTQEVYVVVDFSRRSAREAGQETILEFLLRSALILGMVAHRQGDLFGAITFSNRVQGFLRAGNGKAHYHACRDILYTLQPQIVTPDYEDLFSFIRLRLRRRALLIILTDLNDPMLAETFVRSCSLISRQHLVLVNMIRPEGAHPLFHEPDVNSLDEVYQRLSGHLVWENLQDLRNVLHRSGVQLSQLQLSTMSVELVNQYFSVKQRQLL